MGTRNYIAVVAASNCAAHTAELIAHSFAGEELPSNVDGVVAFPHGEGCGHTIGPDTEQLQRTLAGVLAHPNVSAAIILGLGCEVNQIEPLPRPECPAHRPPRRDDAARERRHARRGGSGAHRDCPADRAVRRRNGAWKFRPRSIVLGLNCGGSDSFSGITANPALGVCSDMLAAIGATAVLAETTEIFGAEHLLVRRARNRQVAEKLLGFIDSYKQYLTRFARQLRRQSIARQQRRRLDQHPRKIAGRRGQGRHFSTDRRGGLRRARYALRASFS